MRVFEAFRAEEREVNMKNRAVTPKQKREVVERILAAWIKSPHERLGQFIVNALPSQLDGDPFMCEDFELAELCEARVKGK